MAIQVHHGGTVDSFDFLAFPEQNPANNMYIQNQLSNFSQSLTDIGRKFIETSQAIYERVNDSNAMRIAEAAVRMARGMFHPNTVVHLSTLDELRFAQPMMQRYIMAEPTLREVYHRQQCDGYSDTYADIEPKAISENHYDYRRVMDAVIVDIVDENGDDSWVSRNYIEELHPDDKPLDIIQKADILSTWEIVKMFVAAGQDPTNPFAAK